MLKGRYVHNLEGKFSIWIQIWTYLYNDPLKNEKEIIERFSEYSDIKGGLERMPHNRMIAQDEDTGECTKKY